ncbi:hypothetical protein [Duganella sp. HH105]|uniref:hypothetical protein n=1 Tax=Duganella sp. HH105 TaxID=1781067 RepID=UPI000877D0DE|nr:hypothetical protein [Duganella sp. HH105]OEZ61261.1 hypothetical protein DUGA6_22870 [Duganella sp. HH105]
MSTDDAYQAAIAEIQKQHGSREQFIFSQLERMAISRQRCDITLFNDKPKLDVLIDPQFSYALMYGAGAAKLAELLNSIQLSNGDRIGFKQIWTINPMPQEGLSDAELAAVDLSDADVPAGPNGESLREMVSKSYHCSTPAEEERYVRRFLAS